jgi:hypothetical protein
MLYGIPVLAIALLITRGLPLIGVGFDGQTTVNRLLEIAAGVFLLIGEGNPRGRFGYGWTLTGIYMLTIGVLWLVGANTGFADIITGSLAALAAVLLFTSGRNTYRQWTGTVLLAIWLADMALTDIIHLQFLYHAKITMGLAVAAGAFLLARR